MAVTLRASRQEYGRRRNPLVAGASRAARVRVQRFDVGALIDRRLRSLASRCAREAQLDGISRLRPTSLLFSCDQTQAASPQGEEPRRWLRARILWVWTTRRSSRTWKAVCPRSPGTPGISSRSGTTFSTCGMLRSAVFLPSTSLLRAVKTKMFPIRSVVSLN